MELCGHKEPAMYCPWCARDEYKAQLDAMPVIDLSRFHKGPLTAEQLKELEGRFVLYLHSTGYGVARIKNSRLKIDGFDATYKPSAKIKLWYPLPEVTP